MKIKLLDLLKLSVNPKRLHPVRLSDKAATNGVLCTSRCESCENSFATLFMWANAYDTQIMKWRDMLIVYNPKNRILHFPWGREPTPRELSKIYKTFADDGMLGNDYIYNVPPGYQLRYPEAEKYFSFGTEEEDADYIYPVEKLIGLTGSKLRKKRNHIKRFLAAYPDFRVEEITPKNAKIAHEFMKRIDEDMDLPLEKAAIDRGMKYFKELDLCGIILYATKSDIASVAVMSPICNKVYDVHFEKSDKQFEGAIQYMVKAEAEFIRGMGGEYINREQDLGDENLRHANRSLDHIRMYERQRAFPKR